MSWISSSPGLLLEIKVPEQFLDHEEFSYRMEEVLMDIAVETRNFWETEAGRRLKSSRDKYIKSIYMKQTEGGVNIGLDSAFANLIELGTQGFDLKPGFNKSNKLKTGKVKIPRAVAENLKAKAAPNPSRRWMIIPLDTQRTGSPDTFRTYTTDAPSDKWMYPAKDGMKIHEQVIEELKENIIPNRIDKLIDEVYGL